MAAPMAEARIALRLLQISRKTRLLVQQPRQLVGVLGQFRRYLADDSSKGDGVSKPGIELSHPKAKLQSKMAAVDSTSSSSSDSSGDSSDGSSSSDSESDDDLSPELVSAAGDVAKALGGDTQQTASDLLAQLRRHQNLTTERKDGHAPPTDISKVFDGMRVQAQRQWSQRQTNNRNVGASRRPRSEQSDTEFEQDQRMEEGILAKLTNELRGREGLQSSPGMSRARGRQQAAPRSRRGEEIQLKLFDGKGLGIFTEAAKKKEESEVMVQESLYDRLQREDLAQQISLPAENAFEEQIRWTRQGKLWTFPIDNEQGMHEEAKVGFQEHVFLEPLIADFPRRGPIRHFMELVCVGLSKNPHLTVEEKKEHIDWFRNYFEEKKHILDEVIIDPSQVTAGESEAKAA